MPFASCDPRADTPASLRSLDVRVQARQGDHVQIGRFRLFSGLKQLN